MIEGNGCDHGQLRVRGAVAGRPLPSPDTCGGRENLPGRRAGCLIGAHLIGLGVTYCQLHDASFTNAEFHGTAEFGKAGLVPEFVGGWSAAVPGRRVSGRRPCR